MAPACQKIYIKSNFGCLSEDDFKAKLEKKIAKRNKGEQHPKPIRTYKQKKKQSKLSLFGFINTELQAIKDSKMRKRGVDSIRVHASIIRSFIEYYGGKKLFSGNDVDWNFRDEFMAFLASRNAQLNYGNKTLKVLKQFWNPLDERSFILKCLSRQGMDSC